MRRAYLRVLPAGLAVLIALPAAALAATGGQPAPGSGGQGADGGSPPVDEGITLTSRRGLLVRRALKLRGRAQEAAGGTVTIEARSGEGAWEPVATADADRDGLFDASWKPSTAGRFELRAVVGSGAEGASASSHRSSAPRPVTVYRSARATWYGPGFFGRRTACGQRLRRSTVGVAHKSLPCGTKVAISYGKRSVVARVIDRGPYARGVQYDLTQATARKLGFDHTARIGALALSR